MAEPMKDPKKVRALNFYQVHIDDNGKFDDEDPILVQNGDFIQFLVTHKKDWLIEVKIKPAVIKSAGGSVNIHS